jgi:OOP family OmpA-OmpF porin
MKKLILIPALIAGTLAMAEQKKFEISPMFGYNFAEGNLNIKDDGYPVGGIEVQFNTPDSKISPEFSLLYSEGVQYKTTNDTKILRGAFNGVYTFDALDFAVPFAKVGVGYEKVSNEVTQNESGFFADAGAGVKFPMTDYLALKLEAIYMAKFNSNNAGCADSNLVTMAGLTFAFGGEEQKPAPVAAPVEEKIAESVAVPAAVAVAVTAVTDGDDDKDGVANSIDRCPNTVAGAAVDTHGCAIKIALEIHFEYDSAAIKPSSDLAIQEYADFLKKYTDYSSKIVGHTDSRGSEVYNQKLSEKRAQNVVNALVTKGVNTKQLSALGQGEKSPVASNMNAEGRAQNRRIEAEMTLN